MPDAVDPRVVDFLVDGYWQWDGEDPHHWGKDVVTVNVSELTSEYRTWVQEAAAQVSAVADIGFQFISTVADITFHLRDGSGDSSSSVHSGGIISSAQVWIDPPSVRQDILHEFGHVLGLGHAGPYNGDGDVDTDVLPPADQDLTVMSYNGVEDGALEEPMEFQEADLAAFVRLYGAVDQTPTDPGEPPSPPPPPPPEAYNYITGDNRNNSIAGTAAADYILAKGGNDYVTGWTGNDMLAGGAGNDDLRGGGGNDNIKAGLGVDVLTGGGGADRFVYDADDRIVDYQPGIDTLVLVTNDYWA